MVAYAPKELYPTRKYGFLLSAHIRRGGIKASAKICCGSISETLGHNKTCPYSIGETLIRTKFGDLLISPRSINSVRPGSSFSFSSSSSSCSSKVNSTSFWSALVKLNFFPSNSWHTRSILNSVCRFFVALPSLYCATYRDGPSMSRVSTAVTSYRNNPPANRSSHASIRTRSKSEASWTYPVPFPDAPEFDFVADAL